MDFSRAIFHTFLFDKGNKLIEIAKLSFTFHAIAFPYKQLDLYV